MIFPASGVETQPWLPPLAAFAVSYFTSMAGVSGAFLLLPFQMSVLGFTSPAVSPTNMVYNCVAIPGGVYRYLREGRMVWPLTAAVAAGTLPGVILGALLRIQFLPDPKPFKAFVGCILLYIGVRLFIDFRAGRKPRDPDPTADTAVGWQAELVELSWRRLVFRFHDHSYLCNPITIFALSLVVGVIGGAYGIGGGAIIAPVFVAIFGLPIHAVAGATLMGTFLTSVVGVLFYQLIAPLYSPMSLSVAPDWLLGSLFGVGGLAGIYLGARTQRFVPISWLKLLLGFVLVTVALRYIAGYLFS